MERSRENAVSEIKFRDGIFISAELSKMILGNEKRNLPSLIDIGDAGSLVVEAERKIELSPALFHALFNPADRTAPTLIPRY